MFLVCGTYKTIVKILVFLFRCTFVPILVGYIPVPRVAGPWDRHMFNYR